MSVDIRSCLLMRKMVSFFHAYSKDLLTAVSVRTLLSSFLRIAVDGRNRSPL